MKFKAMAGMIDLMALPGFLGVPAIKLHTIPFPGNTDRCRHGGIRVLRDPEQR